MASIAASRTLILVICSGMFIALEGPDGSGKTTLARTLRARLLEEGEDVLLLREPGGTPLGEHLRLLLKGQYDTVFEISDRAEALLFAAARAQIVDAIVRPALDAGKTVICDRFIDSSIIYQGHGRRLGASDVGALSRFACDGLRPDLVLVLDLPEDAAAQRRRERGEADRIEEHAASDPSGFAHQVALGYRHLVDEARRLKGYEVVDADQTPDRVAAQAMSLIQEYMSR